MNVEAILQSQNIEYEDLGKRFLVTCPFHDDHHPSAGIWATSGYLKCFACGASASFVDYLVAACDMPKSKAVRLVRGQDDISELEGRIRISLHADDDRFKFFSVKSFHKTFPKLTEGSLEWAYILNRGIESRMISLFDMRSGSKKYRNRVVLPVYTPEGKLVSYVGRAIDPEMAPKTRKSRSPHRTLFGLMNLVRNMNGVRLLYIVVVEGEFDAIYLQQSGIPAVSNMGTMEMSPEKVRLLRKYAKKVVLSYDGDQAGYEAMYGNSKRVGQLELLRNYIPTVSVELPEGVDPNQLTFDQVEDHYGKFKIQDSL